MVSISKIGRNCNLPGLYSRYCWQERCVTVDHDNIWFYFSFRAIGTSSVNRESDDSGWLSKVFVRKIEATKESHSRQLSDKEIIYALYTHNIRAGEWVVVKLSLYGKDLLMVMRCLLSFRFGWKIFEELVSMKDNSTTCAFVSSTQRRWPATVCCAATVGSLKIELEASSIARLFCLDFVVAVPCRYIKMTLPEKENKCRITKYWPVSSVFWLSCSKQTVALIQSKKELNLDLVGSWSVSVGDLDQCLHLYKYTGGFERVDNANRVLKQDQV